jgi:ABC-type Fe3+-hydroxamate transport system substrate-binding protein
MILSSTKIPYTPTRIISLVPSQTELLYYLGLEKETVGITKFCVHPYEWFHTKTRVGGTKTINKSLIDDLKPDLIIANKEENVKEQVEELAVEYPVWVTDVNDLDDAIKMIQDIGDLTGKADPAKKLAEDTTKKFDEVSVLIKNRYKVTYLIWREPYMSVGGDTFINDMLNRCGFDNVFAHLKRYPTINIDELRSSEFELLLLSTEPFPFDEKHKVELQQLLPGKKIMIVNGETFSWYGSRLLYSAKDLKALITSLTTLN